MENPDVVIIGAGASGLMCAIEAAKRKRTVLVIDHASKAGKKILMSGGGRCNFTNYHISPENYISHNPHFCKSALKRYTQWDFLAMVEKYSIPIQERLHGQLFCQNSAKDILTMLLVECRLYGVKIELDCTVNEVNYLDSGKFSLKTNKFVLHCASLVIASGGLSIPKIGATPFGYQVAAQFGINVWPTRAGLVPLTLHAEDKERYSALSGIAVPAQISNRLITFKENMLFTHRGLSGPVILQISSYWEPGQSLNINVMPDIELLDYLQKKRSVASKQKLQTLLTDFLPKRLIQTLLSADLLDMNIADCSDTVLCSISNRLQAWQLKPNGSEGYRTAEVTLGGVDCAAISSKTMQCLNLPGLFFIGEVLDVTGWLGGYNFQWAWSSGWCAGQYV